MTFKLLIDQFNKKHGQRKHGITYTQINKWLFDGYNNLLTHVDTDRKNKENNIPERRHDKDGLYAKKSVHQIVDILIQEFQINPTVFKSTDNFEIDRSTIQTLKQKYGQDEQKKNTEQIVYLLGSTYQGKQLEVYSNFI